MQLTQLNSVQPIARSRSVELSCVDVAIDTSPTQLNSTRRRVELCRYKRAFSQQHVAVYLVALHTSMTLLYTEPG